ncbi:MAG: hypothetical protein IJP90_05810 [Treponema sp.]|nr:hypothetical protein [Treponema sp.]
MVTTYTMRPSEMTIDFIKSIQAIFKNKQIEINIHEVSDETDYLLSSSANKNHLFASIAEAKKHEKLITVSEDSL